MSKQIPTIVVNFKTYAEATGEKALNIAKEAERVWHETDISIGVAPQFTDLARIADSVDIPVFAQHMDPDKPGSRTGHISALAVKDSGAAGTLVNHSERQLILSDIHSVIETAQNSHLLSIVCADSPEAGASVAALRPDAVAIEPPELIGTGIPVSKAKPEIVTASVRLIRSTDAEVLILCGAGISRGGDVKAALELGTHGVLVASGIVRAKDPRTVLLEFAEAAKTRRNCLES